MNFIKYKVTLWLVLFGLVLPGLTSAQTSAQPKSAPLSSNAFQSEHQRGVDLARAEKYAEGLKILQALLQQQPRNYDVIRDIVIITTWMENCPAALKRYKQIQTHAKQEAYLLGPVSQCLYETGSKKQAFDKLNSAIAQWPDDSELKKIRSELLAQEKTKQQREIARNKVLARKSVVTVSTGINESDQGNQERSVETSYKRKMQENIQLYVRSLAVRADDPQFDTGDLNRIGIGAEINLHSNWKLIQDFSFDIDRSSEGGSTTTVIYSPNSLWAFDLSYATYAEDLPLRAKAQLIDSNRATSSVDFHTEDYLWTWSAAIASYDFSDGNNRNSISTALSYAYVLQDDLEQRIIFDVYKSANSNDNSVVYYNPKSDLSLGLTHQLDIVYDSIFKRHVDHLYVSIGRYKQKNISGTGIWGIQFEQEYNFDDINSFGFSVTYNQRVYDGNREKEKAFLINYSRQLQ